jgi:hypothetical protein
MNTALARLLPCALASAALCGCGILSFDVNSKGTTTVQGSAIGAVLPGLSSFGGFDNFDISQQAGFDNNDTRKDHITSTRLTKLTVKVVSPSGQDLSFFTSLKFTISASKPQLPAIEIAHRESFPAGATSVDLTIDDVDIAAYAKADNFAITTQASGHAPTQDTTIEADLSLNIHANPL